jgi:uncharacterized membrane protein
MRWWETAWNGNAWDGATPWFMFLPMLWPIMMIGAIALVVIMLMRGRIRETPLSWRLDQSMRLTPLEILRERLARGEIDKTEYEETRRVIAQG